MSDLFTAAAEQHLRSHAPLAARLRPRTLDDVVGQEHLVGPGKALRRLVEQDRLTSAIFWGPPGTGKTTLALAVAGSTKRVFEQMSAVNAGIKDVRDVIERARQRIGEHGRGTILFLDEKSTRHCAAAARCSVWSRSTEMPSRPWCGAASRRRQRQRHLRRSSISSIAPVATGGKC